MSCFTFINFSRCHCILVAFFHHYRFYNILLSLLLLIDFVLFSFSIPVSLWRYLIAHTPFNCICIWFSLLTESFVRVQFLFCLIIIEWLNACGSDCVSIYCLNAFDRPTTQFHSSKYNVYWTASIYYFFHILVDARNDRLLDDVAVEIKILEKTELIKIDFQSTTMSIKVKNNNGKLWKRDSIGFGNVQLNS